MPLECRQLEAPFLHAYVDGEFSPEECAEVRAHLAGCAACSRAVHLHQSFKGAMARAAVTAPHSLHDSVRTGLAAETQGRWARAFRDPRPVGIAAAAVGATAWVLAGRLQHPLWQPQPYSLTEDGVALPTPALPLRYAASGG